ncbi:hypothetical protein DXG03_004843 [Asterophora parasitica]|uniref:Uncharacterized protein n=1 Tax=Asterophora parasitica TaxID=117018 RepID=A0A9P7FQF0_9AGAR|nr:hypothetical protein DXG03_004843 [Asterophora parasitica]
MRTGAYVADLPGDVPGWDSAAVPLEWADTALFDLDAWGGGKKMSMSMDLSGLYDDVHRHEKDNDSAGHPAGPAYALEHDIHSLPPLPRAFRPVFTNPFSSATKSSFGPSSAPTPSTPFSKHSENSPPHSRRDDSETSTGTVASVPTPSTSTSAQLRSCLEMDLDPHALFARMSLDDSDVGIFAFRRRSGQWDSSESSDSERAWNPIRIPALPMRGNSGDTSGES